MDLEASDWFSTYSDGLFQVAPDWTYGGEASVDLMLFGQSTFETPSEEVQFDRANPNVCRRDDWDAPNTLGDWYASDIRGDWDVADIGHDWDALGALDDGLVPDIPATPDIPVGIVSTPGWSTIVRAVATYLPLSDLCRFGAASHSTLRHVDVDPHALRRGVLQMRDIADHRTTSTWVSRLSRGIASIEEMPLPWRPRLLRELAYRAAQTFVQVYTPMSADRWSAASSAIEDCTLLKSDLRTWEPVLRRATVAVTRGLRGAAYNAAVADLAAAKLHVLFLNKTNTGKALLSLTTDIKWLPCHYWPGLLDVLERCCPSSTFSARARVWLATRYEKSIPNDGPSVPDRDVLTLIRSLLMEGAPVGLWWYCTVRYGVSLRHLETCIKPAVAEAIADDIRLPDNETPSPWRRTYLGADQLVAALKRWRVLDDARADVQGPRDTFVAMLHNAFLNRELADSMASNDIAEWRTAGERRQYEARVLGVASDIALRASAPSKLIAFWQAYYTLQSVVDDAAFRDGWERVTYAPAPMRTVLLQRLLAHLPDVALLSDETIRTFSAALDKWEHASCEHAFTGGNWRIALDAIALKLRWQHALCSIPARAPRPSTLLPDSVLARRVLRCAPVSDQLAVLGVLTRCDPTTRWISLPGPTYPRLAEEQVSGKLMLALTDPQLHLDATCADTFQAVTIGMYLIWNKLPASPDPAQHAVDYLATRISLTAAQTERLQTHVITIATDHIISGRHCLERAVTSGPFRHPTLRVALEQSVAWRRAGLR